MWCFFFLNFIGGKAIFLLFTSEVIKPELCVSDQGDIQNVQDRFENHGSTLAFNRHYHNCFKVISQ